jgi:hypothetical protein
MRIFWLDAVPAIVGGSALGLLVIGAGVVIVRRRILARRPLRGLNDPRTTYDQRDYTDVEP